MDLSAELKDQPIPELIPSSFFFAVVGGLLSKLSQSGDLPLSSIRRDHRVCKSWTFVAHCEQTAAYDSRGVILRKRYEVLRGNLSIRFLKGRFALGWNLFEMRG